MIDMKLQKKLLKVLNDHYKEEGQEYDSFILYAFQEDKDDSLGIRAIFHKVGVIKLMGAHENLKKELDEEMDTAYKAFKMSQMH